MHTTMRKLWHAADSCPNGISRRRGRDTFAIATALVACTVFALHAQPAQAPQLTDTLAAAAAQAEPSGEVSTLTFFNRPIVVLRARVLGRLPHERVTAAESILRQLVEAGVTGPVAAQTVEGGALITVGFRPVFGVVAPDIDPLSGETLDEVTRQAVARLQQALDEASEARRPGVLARSVALAIVALVAGALALWGISRSRRAAAQRLIDLAAKTAARTGVASAEALRASRVLQVERRLVNGIAFILYCADPLRRRHVRPPPLPVYPSVGRVDARVSDRHRTITRSRRRERDSRVLHGRADPAARQVVHAARRHLLQCGRTRADRCAAVDASRDGAADPPAAHRGDVAVRHRRRLSVPAGQRYRGVQAASASSSA